MQIPHPTKNITEIDLYHNLENKIKFISVYIPPKGNDARDVERKLVLKQLD